MCVERGLQALHGVLFQLESTVRYNMNHHAHIGEVPGLHHPVSSQYADGLFTQHPNSSGQVYNVSEELFLVLHIQLLYNKKGATQSSLVPRPGGSGLGTRLPPSHEGG